ncbi:peroxisomal coenzyme A diphosphatase NUDT7 [Amia ocellicauda]|uniref:peroxisomal coenzyme A diphosphatase NUDT7 n=1 Tax=Amia ocellicauda TaxID=2972642 RepID=UPI00346436DB
MSLRQMAPRCTSRAISLSLPPVVGLSGGEHVCPPRCLDTVGAIEMSIAETTKAMLKKYEIGSKFSYLSSLPKASVLIPLFVRNGELRVLMTVRSQELNTSGGEVCFPGGKYDPMDHNEIDTALREAGEEIGLPPDQVEVVCRLFPVMSKTGIVVTPVVAFIKESFQAQPNPEEVSDIFSVPLDYFINPALHTSHAMPGQPVRNHFFTYQDNESGKSYLIWGLTATLALLVAVLALEKKPSFPVGFNIEDPLPHFQRSLDQWRSRL